MTRSELAKLARTRLVPIAFLTAIALIANSTCHKAERTHATIELDVGGQGARIHAIDAELLVGDEVVGTFHRTAVGPRIGVCRFPAAMPAADGRIRGQIELIGGEVREFDRAVHADEGATVTVPLAAVLQ